MMDKVIEAFTVEMGEQFLSHLIFHYAVVFGCFVLVMLAVFSDLFYAIDTAKHLGERIKSHKLRRTVEKLTRYWGCLLLAAAAGSLVVVFPAYRYPYITMLVTAVLVLTEGRSIWEHVKRRKDHLSKLPEAVQDIVDFCKDNGIKELIKDEVNRQLSSPEK